nr:MAG TPA: hypothetical protein [Caudoviricetes sp.]
MQSVRICSDALSSILSVNTFADAYFPSIVFNVFSFLVRFYSRLRTISTENITEHTSQPQLQ